MAREKRIEVILCCDIKISQRSTVLARAAERQLLKQVLALLNSVDAAAPENLNGLTGRQTGRGKASDQELRDLLKQVLN